MATATPQAGPHQQAWDSLVAQHVAAGLSKREAINKCIRENSELHQAYLLEFNAARGRKLR